jgi:hypothetical protein
MATPSRSIGTEAIVAPVTGSVHADGVGLTQADVRVEEADVRHPTFVAGPDGAHLLVIFAERRALRVALGNGAIEGPLVRRPLIGARRSRAPTRPARRILTRRITGVA